jgi:hypothetical protein
VYDRFVKPTGGSESFEVRTDTAYAWYFVLAHWPNRTPRPLLNFDQPTIQIALDDQQIEELSMLLKGALELQSRVAESSDALLAELRQRGLGFRRSSGRGSAGIA